MRDTQGPLNCGHGGPAPVLGRLGEDTLHDGGDLVIGWLSGSKTRPIPVTWGDRRGMAMGHDDQRCLLACST
jgi:hypothetical protein